MRIDWWTLGLQAINVLILIWLLGRYFWTPISGIIAQRQQLQQDLLAQAEAARDAARAEEAVLARSDQERAQLRDEALAAAGADALKLRYASLAQARADAQAMLDAARAEAARLRDATQQQLVRDAVALALRIARRLLARLHGPTVHNAFCATLEQALRDAPPDVLAGARGADWVEVVSSEALEDTQRKQCAQRIRALLGGQPAVHWRVDPELLAGVELHAADLVVRNSWHADLQQIADELAHE